MGIILTSMLHQKPQHLVEMAMDPIVMEMDQTEILTGQMEMGMDPIVIAMDLMNLKDQMDLMDQMDLVDQMDRMDPMDPMDLMAQTEMDLVDFVRRSHVKYVSR